MSQTRDGQGDVNSRNLRGEQEGLRKQSDRRLGTHGLLAVHGAPASLSSSPAASEGYALGGAHLCTLKLNAPRPSNGTDMVSVSVSPKAVGSDVASLRAENERLQAEIRKLETAARAQLVELCDVTASREALQTQVRCCIIHHCSLVDVSILQILQLKLESESKEHLSLERDAMSGQMERLMVEREKEAALRRDEVEQLKLEREKERESEAAQRRHDMDQLAQLRRVDHVYTHVYTHVYAHIYTHVCKYVDTQVDMEQLAKQCQDEVQQLRLQTNEKESEASLCREEA